MYHVANRESRYVNLRWSLSLILHFFAWWWSSTVLLTCCPLVLAPNNGTCSSSLHVFPAKYMTSGRIECPKLAHFSSAKYNTSGRIGFFTRLCMPKPAEQNYHVANREEVRKPTLIQLSDSPLIFFPCLVMFVNRPTRLLPALVLAPNNRTRSSCYDAPLHFTC